MANHQSLNLYHFRSMMNLKSLLLLPLLSAASVRAAEPFIEKMDLFKAGEGGYKLYHIPGVLVTAKGSILAWCEARKKRRRLGPDRHFVAPFRR